MNIVPYLEFDGACEQAFKFYQQSLGGEMVAMITHDAAPPEMPVADGWRKKIMHAYLKIGPMGLMGSDVPPEQYQRPRNMSVMLGVPEPAEAERLFHLLATDGTVKMPIQETFWSPRFGMLVDQFGIAWIVNCEQRK